MTKIYLIYARRVIVKKKCLDMYVHNYFKIKLYI